MKVAVPSAMCLGEKSCYHTALFAHRGFGRTELAKTCDERKIWYLIRIKPDVSATHPSYTGVLRDYPVKKAAVPSPELLFTQVVQATLLSVGNWG